MTRMWTKLRNIFKTCSVFSNPWVARVCDSEPKAINCRCLPMQFTAFIEGQTCSFYPKFLVGNPRPQERSVHYNCRPGEIATHKLRAGETLPLAYQRFSSSICIQTHCSRKYATFPIESPIIISQYNNEMILFKYQIYFLLKKTLARTQKCTGVQNTCQTTNLRTCSINILITCTWFAQGNCKMSSYRDVISLNLPLKRWIRKNKLEKIR